MHLPDARLLLTGASGGIGQLLGVVWNGAHGRTSSNSRHYTVARQGLAWLPRPA